jgi:glyoxylate reductase
MFTHRLNLTQGIDHLQRMDCQTRSEFLSNLSDGGKYSNLVAFYRHNSSADRIGVFDAELVNALPSSCKWIAHNGAGYDQIDIAACQKKGMDISF